MASPYDFINSQAVRNYRPNLMTSTPMAQAQPEAPDLTNRMLEILGGNFGGTLSSGERLSALGALLKSVSRGSQTSPQQVMQAIQQQKLGQVQGALQVQELRRQAAEKANATQIRERLLANAKTEEERDQIRLLDDAGLQQFALKRLENKTPEMETKQRQLATYYQMREEDPARASAYWRLLNPTQVIGTIETGFKEYNTPEPPREAAPSGGAPTTTTGGLTDLAPPTPKPTFVDPNRIPQINTGLEAIKDLRELSQKFLSAGKQAGNIAEAPLFGSLLGQNRANLEGSLEILRGIIIQDQLARLAKINPAGVASLANSPSEQERFVSAIANLDPNQDPQQLLIGLKRAEDYLKRQKAEATAKPSGQKKPSAPKTFTIDGKKITITPKG
jgi:hypothetical protein